MNRKREIVVYMGRLLKYVDMLKKSIEELES